MNSSLVSIVIPTYNRTNFLKLTLENLQEQTYTNIEVIVVDDGTPGSQNELLCKEFKNVSYYKIKNTGGPANPRNFGATKVKGEYIAFLDDDDLWVKNKIETQIKVLEENPEVGIVHSCCELIDQNGVKLGTIIGKPRNPSDKSWEVLHKMFGNWTLMMPTPLIRKTVLDQVGGFNVHMPSAGEDMEFWVRCAFYTQFLYIDKPLAYYRVHGGNISNETALYLDLPLYLNKLITNKLNDNLIDKNEYVLLRDRLSVMQLKTIRKNYLKTVNNLFKLDVFWMLKNRNIKTFIKKVILKK